jgi:hypothetical protein
LNRASQSSPALDLRPVLPHHRHAVTRVRVARFLPWFRQFQHSADGKAQAVGELAFRVADVELPLLQECPGAEVLDLHDRQFRLLRVHRQRHAGMQQLQRHDFNPTFQQLAEVHVQIQPVHGGDEVFFLRLVEHPAPSWPPVRQRDSA